MGLKKVGIDFGSLEMRHYCFVEWRNTYSNLDKCAEILHNSDRSEAALVETPILTHIFNFRLSYLKVIIISRYNKNNSI